MITPPLAAGLALRSFAEGDQSAVVGLLQETLTRSPTGGRSPALFRWKHLDSPFGPSHMLVAWNGDRAVGFRAFMRWRLRSRIDGASRVVEAVRAVDTVTHPDFQGLGIFTALTKEALATLPPAVELVFNTPNDRSLPGYLKMGWHVVGKVPVRLRVCSPLTFAAGVRSLGNGPAPRGSKPLVEAPTAAEVLEDRDGLDDLLARGEDPGRRFVTDRDVDYLRWRYEAVPALDYRAEVVRSGDGRLAGVAIFRVRARGRLWEAAVSELLVPEGDTRTARLLLKRVARAADVAHLICSLPPATAVARAAARSGFVPVPAGPTLVAKQLRAGVDPDPSQLRSWALGLGDVEVL